MTQPSKDPTSRSANGAGKGVAIGAGAGMIFGAAFGNPGAGLVIGAALGLVLASISDRTSRS